MAENSKIEWTTHTLNPWWGCSKVAAGCTHCYAESLSKRTGRAKWGDNGVRQMTSAANWREPLKWNKAAQAAGERHRVFCASMADVFEDWSGPVLHHSGETAWGIESGNGPWHARSYFGESDPATHGGWRQPTLDDLRRDLFELIDATPHLDWLLLTKRPENIGRMWPKTLDCDFEVGSYANVCEPRQNVWLGTSIATQADADRNIPLLLECRELAPVLFLSIEPLVGPVNLTNIGDHDGRPLCCLSDHPCVDDERGRGEIDWVIVGAESGHGARPMHPDWARSIRDQCQAAKVPFLFKQWGEWIPRDVVNVSRNHGYFEGDEFISVGKRWDQVHGRLKSNVVMEQVGKKAAGRLLDGREWNEFPKLEPTP